MKYLNSAVTFREIPDEITLCINITNCPHKCIGCHSPELQQDIGQELTLNALDKLLSTNKGVTCIVFMGGDKEIKILELLLKFVKCYYPNLKTAWYSGEKTIPLIFDLTTLDFLKLGSYIKEYGPLDKKTTNQRLYRLKHIDLFTLFEDITYKFWK